MAAQLAIILAISLKKDHFIIKGDLEVVILSLQNPKFVRDWRISSIILDSLETIPFASCWEVRKISRSANFCAHLMTRWVAARSHSGNIPMSSFPFLVTVTHNTYPPLFYFLM
jgi:hypothetical protein